MKRQTGIKRIWQGLVLVTASLLAGFTQAAGLLTPGDGSLPALEIRDHQVEVLIEDGYAITTVEQVFVLTGEPGSATELDELRGRLMMELESERAALEGRS